MAWLAATASKKPALVLTHSDARLAAFQPPLQWQHPGRLVAAVCLWSKCRFQGRQPGVGVASSVTQLLVDGDCHSIEGIKHAISSLEAEGRRVVTTLFAAPGRWENKKWSRFMRAHGIRFQAVERDSLEHSTEPNDEIIMSTMAKLCHESIALLTEDADFVGTMVDFQESGADVMVMIPDTKHSVIDQYQNKGVRVLLMRIPRSTPKVRAILHENGTGSVEIVEPELRSKEDFFSEKAELVMKTMEFLGYRRGRGYFVQDCAKFWISNQLGPLTVFPSRLSLLAVHDIFAQSARLSWKVCSDDLAFFLPTTTTRGSSRCTHRELQVYGSGQARAVFEGGGPFMLKDTADLTVRALTRLGYLDAGLNADVAEAMFLFVNSPDNKACLRKIGMLPAARDTSLEVEAKLRAAFLSNKTPGEWQIRKTSEKALQPVLKILRRAC
eukprot:Skav235012  [mRNA]  locus=scaffold276:164365:165684:+ [translate_table: standard]